jgi:hypothetical protein
MAADEYARRQAEEKEAKEREEKRRADEKQAADIRWALNAIGRRGDSEADAQKSGSIGERIEEEPEPPLVDHLREQHKHRCDPAGEPSCNPPQRS